VIAELVTQDEHSYAERRRVGGRCRDRGNGCRSIVEVIAKADAIEAGVFNAAAVVHELGAVG